MYIYEPVSASFLQGLGPRVRRELADSIPEGEADSIPEGEEYDEESMEGAYDDESEGEGFDFEEEERRQAAGFAQV